MSLGLDDVVHGIGLAMLTIGLQRLGLDFATAWLLVIGAVLTLGLLR